MELSVTVIVGEKLPDAAGVPLIRPVDEIDSPPGRFTAEKFE